MSAFDHPKFWSDEERNNHVPQLRQINIVIDNVVIGSFTTEQETISAT